MASAFSHFRKYQKAMLAVLGVMLMIAFTMTGFVGDIFSRQDGGGGQNPLVATSVFGEFREFDMQDRRIRRNLLRRFFQELSRLPIEDWQTRMGLFQAVGYFSDLSDRTIVEGAICAAEAKQQGIVISDDAITDFLRDQTHDQVTAAQFGVALDGLNGGRRGSVSKQVLYDALRQELMALKFRELFGPRMVLTPAERWDYYQRMNRRVTIEIAPVAAADMVAQVPDPSAQALRSFFEEHKNTEPEPGSPEPGFKIPDRAAFDYFTAHYDDFYKPDAIPAEEVQAEYEKNKDTRYLWTDSHGIDLSELDLGTPPTETPKSEPKTEEPKAEESSSEKPAGDKPADKAKPADESGKSDADAKEPNKCDGAEDEPADKKEKPADAEKPAGDAPKAAEDAKPAADSKPAEEKKPIAGDSGPALGAPAATTPATTDAAADPAAKKATVISLPPLSTKYVLPNDIDQGPKPKYKPLWQVEKQIRKELAGAKAVAKMDDVLNRLQLKVRRASEQMVRWEQNHKENPQAPKPTLPDFAALAKDNPGVTVGHIPLEPAYQVAEVPGIGSSTINNVPFTDYAFRSVRPFQWIKSEDKESNRYLFWKSEEETAHVPALDTVRQEVLRVWKLREARKLMIKQADALAAEARQAGKPLKDVFAKQSNIKVFEAPSFTWLTGGATGRMNPETPPRLSEVAGVVDAGEGFMRSVFDLSVGEVGVAQNHPQSVAYVVRIVDSQPSTSVLRDGFLVDRFDRYASAANPDGRRLYEEWAKSVNESAKLVWVRPPAQSGAAE